MTDKTALGDATAASEMPNRHDSAEKGPAAGGTGGRRSADAQQARETEGSRSERAAETMRPVFVVGCQRSGSTLLGAMLGAHPDVICIPEGQFIADLMPPRNSSDEVDPAEVIDRVERHWRYRIWNFDLKSARPSPGQVERTYGAAIEWLIRRYAAEHDRENAGIWVDHQPGHVVVISRLLKRFPDAKVINIIRDGRAVAASIMPLDWGPNEIYSAARFWERRIGRAFAASHSLGSDVMHHVRYEDLLSDPAATIREISAFIGIPFRQEMLTGSGLNVPAFTRSQHSLVGRSLDSSRIDAWRTKLSRRQIEIFEKMTGCLLEELGYELLSAPDAPRLRGWEKASLVTLDLVKRLKNHVSFEIRRRYHSS